MLREEAGYTIIEAVITCVLTLIVSSTALAVIDRAYVHNDKIQRRAEGLQQARTALDYTQRVLRSQVCSFEGATPVVSANGSSLTFYASFGSAAVGERPDKHVLSVDSSGTMTDLTYTGVAGTPTSYPSYKTRIVARNIAQSGTTPIFQYYGYDTQVPPEASVRLNATTAPYAVPSVPATLARIGRIAITLRGEPEKGSPASKATLGTTLKDDVFVRLVDPTEFQDSGALITSPPKAVCT